MNRTIRVPKDTSIGARWLKAVGPQIVNVTEIVELTKDATLVVKVRTQAWHAQLIEMEARLIQRCRTAGLELVAIRWVGGPWSG